MYSELFIILIAIFVIIYYYSSFYIFSDGFNSNIEDFNKTLNINLHCDGPTNNTNKSANNTNWLANESANRPVNNNPRVVVPIYSPWRMYWPIENVYPYNNLNYPYNNLNYPYNNQYNMTYPYNNQYNILGNYLPY
jgi:hypothetical protein